MNLYQINEGNLMIPASWEDKSLNIFQIPANAQAKEASLLISRDASQGERSFSEFIADQVRQCEQQLPNFKLIHRYDFTTPYCYAWLDYTWQAQERTVMLRQIFFERKPANLIFTLTTTPEDAAGHDATWRDVMRSTKLTELIVPDSPVGVI